MIPPPLHPPPHPHRGHRLAVYQHITHTLACLLTGSPSGEPSRKVISGSRDGTLGWPPFDSCNNGEQGNGIILMKRYTVRLGWSADLERPGGPLGSPVKPIFLGCCRWLSRVADKRDEWNRDETSRSCSPLSFRRNLPREPFSLPVTIHLNGSIWPVGRSAGGKGDHCLVMNPDLIH